MSCSSHVTHAEEEEVLCKEHSSSKEPFCLECQCHDVCIQKDCYLEEPKMIHLLELETFYGDRHLHQDDQNKFNWQFVDSGIGISKCHGESSSMQHCANDGAFGIGTDLEQVRNSAKT